MITPTGWRKALRLFRIGLVCVVSYGARPRCARADVALRITGTLSIEANASLRHGTSELAVRLLDDAGHPVANAEVHVKAEFGSARAFQAHECGGRALLSPRADGEYVAVSGDSGALCLRFDGIANQAEYDISFNDRNGFYAPASRHVVADTAIRNVEMAFSPSPGVFALERAEQRVTVVTRPAPPLGANEQVEQIKVTLSGNRGSGPELALGSAIIDLGGRAEFLMASRALGGPGHLELTARFAGSGLTRAAQTSTHVTCSALAELSLGDPVAATRPETQAIIHVRVRSLDGAVSSGTVDARVAGVSIGSARVSNGAATLKLPVHASRELSLPVMLSYVADSPWWLAASPLSVTVPISPPSPWPRIGWLAGVLGLCVWLFSNWRRPRRAERRGAAVSRPGGRAAVEVVKVGNLEQGWHGRVLDAHEGTPVAGATLFMRVLAFDGPGIKRTSQADEHGAFAIAGCPGAVAGAILEVRARWHTTLATPMPPPGQLTLSLVSRRRSLLARFSHWAKGDPDWAQRHDPTPGEIALQAQRPDVSAWAHAVDDAAFGPDALSEAAEMNVISREPPHGKGA